MNTSDSGSLRTRLAHYRKYGLGASALQFARSATAPWLDWGTLLFVEQSMTIGQEPTLADGQYIRELSPRDLPLLAPLRRDPARLAQRFARGHRAFALCAKGEEAPLHVRWITTLPTEMSEVNLWIVCGPGDFYCYDVVTHPLYRGHHFSEQAADAIDQVLASHGFRRELGYVRGDNRPMLRSLGRVANPMRVLFKLRYLRRPGHAPLVWGAYGPPLYSSAEPASLRTAQTRLG